LITERDVFAQSVDFSEDSMTMLLDDGRSLSVPLVNELPLNVIHWPMALGRSTLGPGIWPSNVEPTLSAP
jgi:hypothetical protein